MLSCQFLGALYDSREQHILVFVKMGMTNICLVEHKKSATAAVAANMKDGKECVPREKFTLHPNHSKLFI